MTTKIEINYTINNMKGDSAPGKDGVTSDIANYRPFNLLNVFFKIFERIVKKRLLTYLEENLILGT